MLETIITNCSLHNKHRNVQCIFQVLTFHMCCANYYSSVKLFLNGQPDFYKWKKASPLTRVTNSSGCCEEHYCIVGDKSSWGQMKPSTNSISWLWTPWANFSIGLFLSVKGSIIIFQSIAIRIEYGESSMWHTTATR